MELAVSPPSPNHAVANKVQISSSDGKIDWPRRFSELPQDTRHHRAIAHQHGCRLEPIETQPVKEQIRAELMGQLAQASGYDAMLETLRLFKQTEAVRIAKREVVGEVDILQVMQEMSLLADIMLEALIEVVWRKWAQSLELPAPPGRGFTIIGLGTLGGNELTFASDLDLLFVKASDDAAIPEFFAYDKLGQKLLAAIQGRRPYDTIYRVDMRLRPEGQNGSLVITCSQLHEYYCHRAQLWERQALLRARLVAGDMILGHQVIRMIETYVYETPLAPKAVETIDVMRRRIERERGGSADDRDVKLGAGGLADIEFLLQPYQLLYGGTRTALRTSSLWNLLEQLECEELLRPNDVQALRESYCYLRRVQGALRLLEKRASNRLPKGAADLERLAQHLGYCGKDNAEAAEAFLADVQTHTTRVRSIYERLWLFRSVCSTCIHAVFPATLYESACNSRTSESTKRQ